MKRKLKEEIRAKSNSELLAEIKKKQEELLKDGLDVQAGKLKNTSLLKRKRDEIAVLKTILQEKKFIKEETV